MSKTRDGKEKKRKENARERQDKERARTGTVTSSPPLGWSAVRCARTMSIGRGKCGREEQIEKGWEGVTGGREGRSSQRWKSDGSKVFKGKQ